MPYRFCAACVLVLLALAAGCAEGGGPETDSGPGRDAGPVRDGGVMFDDDAGAPPDAGTVTPADAGPSCSGVTCDPHATCSIVGGGPVCACDAGWTGDGSACTDIDECSPTSPCGMGTCVNDPGRYTCVCDPGYVFDAVTCLDVDECAGTPGLCGMGTCTDLDGGYECGCMSGYRFDGATCVAASTVLVFRGSTHAEDTAAADAVTALGLTLIETTTDAAFTAAFDAGGFDAIVWESPSGISTSMFTAAVESRLTSWVTGGGRLIYAYWNFDTHAAFQSTLGVSTTELSTWVDVNPATGAPETFFSGITAPLTGTDRWGDDGDRLTLTGAGFIAATFTSGSPTGAIAVTRSDRVIVNGFTYSDCQATDADGDSVSDCQELLQNQIGFLLP